MGLQLMQSHIHSAKADKQNICDTYTAIYVIFQRERNPLAAFFFIVQGIDYGQFGQTKRSYTYFF